MGGFWADVSVRQSAYRAEVGIHDGVVRDAAEGLQAGASLRDLEDEDGGRFRVL